MNPATLWTFGSAPVALARQTSNVCTLYCDGHGERQRPHRRRSARGHFGLRPRVSVRRRHLRDAADLQRRAVSLRPPHAPPADVGRRCSTCRCRSPTIEIAARFDETMRAAGLGPAGGGEAYIRMLVTRGIGDLTYDPAATPEPSFVVIVKPHVDPPSRTIYEQGVKVALVAVVRNHPGTGQPADQVEQPAEQRAGDAGSGQARRLRGHDAELPRRAGRVHDGEPLHRQGRRRADAAARRRPAGRASRGSFCSKWALTPASRFASRCCGIADLFGADEAFLTSTTREIVPIVTVDDRTIGNGRPGPVTNALLQRFREKARSVTGRPTS